MDVSIITDTLILSAKMVGIATLGLVSAFSFFIGYFKAADWLDKQKPWVQITIPAGMIVAVLIVISYIATKNDHLVKQQAAQKHAEVITQTEKEAYHKADQFESYYPFIHQVE